jgi:hypothetical protein
MEIKQENSVGAQFLNVPGKKLKELEDYIRQQISNLYIGRANIFDIDIIYKTFITSEVLDFSDLTIIGYVVDGENTTSYDITESKTVYDFYTDEGHVAIIDADKRLCYLRQKYDYITIQGAMHYDIILHHVWNCFDEFGMIVGCTRIFGESNFSYKQRILDVFNKPGSANITGIINAISRELEIPSTDIQVNSLSDAAFNGTLLNDDGSPSNTLIMYAKKVNEVMATTWGEASWDKGYWASVNVDNIGLDYLPHVWDASTDGWNSNDFQSGIGAGDDLYVEAPKREEDTQEFKYHVGVAGVKYEQTKIYPPHSFKFKVTGKGTVVSEAIIPEQYYYTVIAAPKIPLQFRIKAEGTYEQNPRTLFNESAVVNMSNYDALSDTQKKTTYLVSDYNRIEVTDGTKVPNPPQRYVEIKVDMQANEDNTTSPRIDDIQLSWTTTGGTVKSVKVDTQSGESVTGNNYTIGFTSNTWSDTNPVIRVENDDTNLDFTPEGSITLGHGSYYKIIDTEGDWNRSNIINNVVVTGNGDLKLSI